MSILGDRIKKEREELGLTREDLAKKIGVSYSAIAMYEQGNREPNNELTLKMCELFDCSMDYLMGKSEIKLQNDEISLENIKKFYEEKSSVLLKEKYVNKFFNLNLSNFEIQNIVKVLSSDDTEKEENYETLLAELFSVLSLNHNENVLNKIKQLILNYYKEKIELLHKEKLKLLQTKKQHKNIDKEQFRLNCLIKDIDFLISYIHRNTINQFYMCPVYGQISAGQPNWAEENIEGRIPIDTNLMDIVNPEEHFFLRVNEEGMNKVIKNGAFALIHKQDNVDNEEIAAIIVGTSNAILRKITKQDNLIILMPESEDKSFETKAYDKSSIKILGKYVGKVEINK